MDKPMWRVYKCKDKNYRLFKEGVDKSYDSVTLSVEQLVLLKKDLDKAVEEIKDSIDLVQLEDTP